MANQLQWANALSTRASLEAAVAEVVERTQTALAAPADLGIIFISATFASEYPRLMPLLKEKLSVPHLIGCSGGGIIGMDADGQVQEVEGEPALSLTLMSLPGVDVHPFQIDGEVLPDLDSPPGAWEELMGVSSQSQPHFVVFADPFSSRINDFLEGLDFAYPGRVKVGGLSSGGMNSRSALFCDYKLYTEGTVGVALSGNIHLETIVAQGCRRIGRPFLVTEGERNIILKVQGTDRDSTEQPPLTALQELIQTLNEEERQLAQHSLFVGVARDEFKQQLGHGDFLIRNLLGVDPRTGAVAIGDRVRPGQRIQFHLRDAEASAEDLELLLEGQEDGSDETIAGALMFSCLGRGEGLYGEPNFDSDLFRQYYPDCPIAGFFCNGEIGPVGGTTFLHGYTSVFGICRSLEGEAT